VLRLSWPENLRALCLSRPPGSRPNHKNRKIPVAVLCGAIVVMPVFAAPAKSLSQTDTVQRQHQEAVRLARSGNVTEALRILQRLAAEAPNDHSITWDRIVILTWAGKDRNAVSLYEKSQKNPAPDYVLEAVARAYDDLHRYREALTVYRIGQRQSPGNTTFMAGEIRTLTYMDQLALARALASRVLIAHGDNVDVLLAAAEAARASDKAVDALRYADRALKMSPQDRDALRERILSIEAMGAPSIALKLADAMPGLMSTVDIRRMEGSAAAQLVRFGELTPANETSRFADTDRAIVTLDQLIARWSAEGNSAKQDLWRARFDRMIAFHDRSRMTEVISEFEAAERAKVRVPEYVLPAVADAYLYFRQPEKAVEIYRRALTTNPKDNTARLGLSRALIEDEQFGEALRQVDMVAARLSPWRYLKGWPEPVPNTDKTDADVAAAYARLYADDLPEAQRRFSRMVDLAPNSVFIRVGLARVYQARGWPRRAEQELEIAQAQIPINPGVEAAEAQGDLDLQKWRNAEAKAADLLRRFPEDREMQELDRAWQIHNMWKLTTAVERDFSSATNIAGGNGLVASAQLYSPPIAYNWRAYAGYRLAHQREPEGNVTERLYDSGVEFRGIDLTASAEARLAEFGSTRVGGQVAGDWSLGDQWDVSGEGEIFSTDTPIRALLHHITADAGTLSLGYRESESRDVKTSVQVMPFSDGNVRTSLSTHADQRVYTMPHLELNGTVELSASQNSSTDEPYFNPHHDALGAAGFDLTHILYRRYDFTYDQQLVASVGPYWEQNFGTGLAWTVQYQQQIKSHDTAELSLGVSFARQPYDGQYENTIAVTFNSILRF
jgi:biofilm PGA synthesis protein PgaA